MDKLTNLALLVDRAREKMLATSKGGMAWDKAYAEFKEALAEYNEANLLDWESKTGRAHLSRG